MIERHHLFPKQKEVDMDELGQRMFSVENDTNEALRMSA